MGGCFFQGTGRCGVYEWWMICVCLVDFYACAICTHPKHSTVMECHECFSVHLYLLSMQFHAREVSVGVPEQTPATHLRHCERCGWITRCTCTNGVRIVVRLTVVLERQLPSKNGVQRVKEEWVHYPGLCLCRNYCCSFKCRSTRLAEE